MDTEILFKIFNTGILLPWALLIFFPNWKGTKWMTEWRFPVLLLGGAYLVLLILDLCYAPSGTSIDFTSMASIKNAFMRDEVMLIGWIHYLAFDLFVGMWVLENSQENQLSHYLIVPCLVFTLMYGPVGFVLYWVLRQLFASKVNTVT